MITRKSLADEIDAYDQSIADLNAGKKDCFDAYRDQMEAAGVAKPNIKLEIEAVKAAVRRRRLVAKDADAVEEKDALVDEVFAEITAPTRALRAARSADESAATDQPETAQDEPVASAEVAGDYLREPVAAEQGQIVREGDAPRETDRESGDASRPDTISHSSEPPIPPAETDKAGEVIPSASPAANSHDDFQPPAFLVKKPLRPHCLNPDLCAGSGRDHCYACRKAMAESEAA